MGTAVADLCDAYFNDIESQSIRVLQPGLLHFGGATACRGQAVTLKVVDDNSLVREELEKDGSGKVLVVDNGGSTRCAVLGGNLASLAVRNNWNGVILHGCVRDVGEMRSAGVDIRAIAACPVKSVKRGLGERNVPISVHGALVLPGEWVYGDLDGVIVSDKELTWPRA